MHLSGGGSGCGIGDQDRDLSGPLPFGMLNVQVDRVDQIGVKADTASRQRFSFGYQVNAWDFAGLPVEPALEFLAKSGFHWFEAMAMDSVTENFIRNYLNHGEDLPATEAVTDSALFGRLALFSRAEMELGIKLAGLYANLEFIVPGSWPAERDCLQALSRLLKGFGAPLLILGGGPAETRERPHSAAHYRAFAHALGEIGTHTRELGVFTVYHPHMDCFIETREQLDRAMEVIDTDVVGLCIDPAHLIHAGADPVDIVRTYAEAVGYMHFKDTRVGPELKGVERYEAFCELGAGAVDFEGLTQALLDVGYDGLVTMELDESRDKSAEQSALESIAFVRDTLGLTLEVH